MGKSSGHLPLTHYERTKKFASSQYGTTTARVSGEAQYQFGDCALSLSSLCAGDKDADKDSSSQKVLCTPSGYLYAADAILEYLLQHTQGLKKQRVAWEAQQAQLAQQDDSEKVAAKRSFEQSQKIISSPPNKRSKTTSAAADLKRTSYWLADSQPEAAPPTAVEEPPARPPSPHTGQDLRRKDLWPIQLEWSDDQDASRRRPVCSVSHKAVHAQAVVAYWTTSSPNKASSEDALGQVVLRDVYDNLVKGGPCPRTGRKIKVVRVLQRGGTSFSASGQAVETTRYRPTIT